MVFSSCLWISWVPQMNLWAAKTCSRDDQEVTPGCQRGRHIARRHADALRGNSRAARTGHWTDRSRVCLTPLLRQRPARGGLQAPGSCLHRSSTPWTSTRRQTPAHSEHRPSKAGTSCARGSNQRDDRLRDQQPGSKHAPAAAECPVQHRNAVVSRGCVRVDMTCHDNGRAAAQ